MGGGEGVVVQRNGAAETLTLTSSVSANAAETTPGLGDIITSLGALCGLVQVRKTEVKGRESCS